VGFSSTYIDASSADFPPALCAASPPALFKPPAYISSSQLCEEVKGSARSTVAISRLPGLPSFARQSPFASDDAFTDRRAHIESTEGLRLMKAGTVLCFVPRREEKKLPRHPLFDTGVQRRRKGEGGR
jgi:hypothetical protein